MPRHLALVVVEIIQQAKQVRVFVCVNPGICLELNDNIFDELVPQLKTERDAPGGGCMMAALGPEIARHNESVRHAAADGLTAIFDVLSTLVPGRTEAARRRVAITTYASSIGGLILARVTADDPELSDEILEAVVNF